MIDWNAIQNHWNQNVFLSTDEVLDHFGLDGKKSLAYYHGLRCPRHDGNPHFEKVKLEISAFWCDNQDMSAREVAKHFGTIETMILWLVRPPKRHFRQKITAEQAQQIKSRSWAGETGRKLAKEFGLSTSAISLIKLGKTWNQ